jgi:hypothetical protein
MSFVEYPGQIIDNNTPNAMRGTMYQNIAPNNVRAGIDTWGPACNVVSGAADFSSGPSYESVCNSKINQQLAKQSYWNSSMSEWAWKNSKAESCLKCPKQSLPSFPPAQGFIYPRLDKTMYQGVTGCRDDREGGENPFGGNDADFYDNNAIPNSYTQSSKDCADLVNSSEIQNQFISCLSTGELPWQSEAPSTRQWNPLPESDFLKTSYDRIRNDPNLARQTAKAILEGSLSNSSDMDATLFQKVLNGNINAGTVFKGGKRRFEDGNVLGINDDKKIVECGDSEDGNLSGAVSAAASCGVAGSAPGVADVFSGIQSEGLSPENRNYGNVWEGTLNGGIGVPYSTPFGNHSIYPNYEYVSQCDEMDSIFRENPNNPNSLQRPLIAPQQHRPMYTVCDNKKKGITNEMTNSFLGALYDLYNWKELPKDQNKLVYSLTRDNRSCYLLTSSTFIFFLILMFVLLGVVLFQPKA